MKKCEIHMIKVSFFLFFWLVESAAELAWFKVPALQFSIRDTGYCVGDNPLCEGGLINSSLSVCTQLNRTSFKSNTGWQMLDWDQLTHCLFRAEFTSVYFIEKKTAAHLEINPKLMSYWCVMLPYFFPESLPLPPITSAAWSMVSLTATK